jgi:hypothetical protein
MRNCLILGSGRSGTSMVAGALAGAGYFMGRRFHAADEGNPKGYFEDVEINALNDALLRQVVRFRPPGFLGDWLYPRRIPGTQGWLARLPTSTRIHATPRLEARIRQFTATPPVCFKDPRFCYTLPAWRCFLDDPVYLCVFRHPGATARSIVTECGRDRRLRQLRLTIEDALEVWSCMYEHVIGVHRPEGGEWLFIHYEQFLEGAVWDIVDARLGVKIDRRFGDASLRRSAETGVASPRAKALYRELCALAGYHPGAGGAE